MQRVTARFARPALLAVVALAFADSSIVVLALPDLIGQFDASITGVAWVVTSYNVVLATVALTLARHGRRFSPGALVQVGLAIFFLASCACGLSGNLAVLIAARAVQGLGGALVLAGSLALSAALSPEPRRGRAAWAQATIVGAAAGPAIGGALTQVLGWRSIFFAQAPFAVVALVSLIGLHATWPEVRESTAESAGRRRRIAACVSLIFVSAALVGLLFLAVVMLIDVWQLTPIAAAAVVSAVPVASALAQLVGRRMSRTSAAAGVLLLAGGLAAAGLVPDVRLLWIIGALVVAGAGLGLALPALTHVALSHGAPGAGSWVVGIRHVGLVLGLVVLTPVFAHDLTAAADRSELHGIATVLDAGASGSAKIRLAVDLVPALSNPPTEGLPHFEELVAKSQSTEVTQIGRDLDRVVQAAISRGFRRSFVLAALLAALAVPALWVAYERRGHRRGDYVALIAAIAAAGALLGGEFAAGARTFGERPALLAKCVDHPAPIAAGATESEILEQLDNLACKLGTTRENLIVKVAKSPALGDIVSYLHSGYAKAAGVIGSVLNHIPGV